MVSQVLVFVILDLLEHVQGSLMEVSLHIKLFVSQIVDQSSLLNEIIFTLKSDIFDLLLRMSQVFVLFFLAHISPHSCELLGFVSGVNIVENCELWTKEVSEVADFSISKVEGNEIFMMPNHTSDPLIVRPSSKS